MRIKVGAGNQGEIGSQTWNSLFKLWRKHALNNEEY